VTRSTLADWQVAPRPPIALPAAVVRAFDAYLREAFPRATPDRLRAEVERLSDAFTAERGELPGSYLNRPPVRSAYLAYSHPLQVLRGLAAIDEVRARASKRTLWPEAPTLRVLDAGAGLGAMSQALLLVLGHDRPEAVEVALLDHQKSALRDARELTARVAECVAPDAQPPRIRTVPERLERWLKRARERNWRYDVVLLGGVLNERAEPWRPLLERVRGVIAPGGLAIVVEPALADVARRLMELREDVLRDSTTIAPCTHGGACPLLALRRDWCFSVREASVPPRVRKLARALRHQTDTVRYALWAFAPGAERAPFERPEAAHGRVVTDRMEGRQVICAGGDRVRVASRGAGALRGDLAVRLSGPASPGPSSSAATST
jgi:ribosomal protein RSM22 (predicted rRNA methylase)